MNSLTLIQLLFVHWVADFVFQSDEVAQNKSRFNGVLGWHCYLYFLIFYLCTFNLLFSLLVGLIHFPVDHVTSRINKKLYKKGDIHNFFVSVGFDQFIHVVTIIILAERFLK